MPTSFVSDEIRGEDVAEETPRLVRIEGFAAPEAPQVIWGSKPRYFRKYHFKELLPALFERALRFDEFEAEKGALSWVFTGENAGFTVTIDAATVRIEQTYYDSYGLFFAEPLEEPSGSTLGQYGQRIVGNKSAPWPAGEGPLRELTVRVTNRLSVEVLVNGRMVLEQKCMFEVTQHQMRFDEEVRAAGSLMARASRQVGVSIRPESRHQEILGFGGITSIPSYHMLSAEGREKWWELLRDYNLRIQREYPPGLALKEDLSNWDRLEDALPHYYGDNFPNGEIVDFAYNRRVVEMGGEVWFEFWFLPRWVKEDQHEPTTLLEKPGLEVGAFCRAVVDYCRKSLARSGAAPRVVGIQNERCQPAETLRELVPVLRAELDAAGFSETKLQMSNAATLEEGREYLARFQKYSEVWEQIDYATSNFYDVQKHFFGEMEGFAEELEAFAGAAGRDTLGMELAVQWGRYQADSYRLALRMGEFYHHLLTRFQARALCYCWLLIHSPQPSFSWTRSLFRVDMKNGNVPVAGGNMLRAFGAFSRRVAAGSVRVDCASAESDLLASAYVRDEAGGELVVILINRGHGPIDAVLESSPEMGAELRTEVCSASLPNVEVPGRAVRRADGRWVVRVEPGEILTLFPAVNSLA